MRRQILEDGRFVLSRRLPLRPLDGVPLHEYLCGGIQPVGAEDVRVAAHQLLVDLARHVVEIELAALRRQLGMEDHLHQHVTQFLAHVRQVEAVDRIEQLAAFVNEAARKRLVGLFAVPWAATGRAQPGHGLAKIVYRTHPVMAAKRHRKRKT